MKKIEFKEKEPKKKISLDITCTNYQKLVTIKKETNHNVSQIINAMLEYYLNEETS